MEFMDICEMGNVIGRYICHGKGLYVSAMSNDLILSDVTGESECERFPLPGFTDCLKALDDMYGGLNE